MSSWNRSLKSHRGSPDKRSSGHVSSSRRRFNSNPDPVKKPPDIQDLVSWPKLPCNEENEPTAVGGPGPPKWTTLTTLKRNSPPPPNSSLGSQKSIVKWPTLFQQKSKVLEPRPLFSKINNPINSRRSSSSSGCSTSPEFMPGMHRNVHNHLFVGNIPSQATKADIKNSFNKFGHIQEVVVFENKVKDPNNIYNNSNNNVKSGPPSPKKFGFVIFESVQSVEKALKQPEVVITNGPRKGHKLLIEKRKDSRLQEQMNSENWNPQMWRQILERFNWRYAASKYLFRALTMEDYLAIYVHTVAGYRQCKKEPVKQLMERLIYLSESCPEDLLEILPPSISGLVYNQSGKNKNSYSTHKMNHYYNSTGYKSKTSRHFDIGSILARHPDLFTIEDSTVIYKNTLEKQEAISMLRAILVEGLFIYFFAKFCHGPKFDIKVFYYQRSEPMRSVLLLVTGQSQISSCLSAFFRSLNQVFVYDMDKMQLSLTVDYFHKSNKECMKRYLDLKQPLVFPAPKREQEVVAEEEEEEYNDIASSSGCESNFSSCPHDVLECFLSNPARAETKVLRRLPGPFSEEPNGIVQSVVENILFEDEGLDLVSNPLALDHILNHLELQSATNDRFNSEQRAALKRRVEEETRLVVSRMLTEFNLIDN